MDPRHIRRRPSIRSRLVLFLLATLVTLPAAAEWRAEAGADLGEQTRRAYVGAEIPLSGQLHDGLVQRIWLDWQGHAYGSGAAAEYALGYQGQGSAGWWGGYLGLQYRDPERARARASDDGADEPWRLGLHLEGQLQLGPDWTASGRLDTFPGSKGYQVRGRLLRGIGDGLSLGPELLLERDRDRSAQQLGLVLQGFRPMPGVEAAVKAGVQRDDSGDTGGFIGVEFSHRY